MAKEKKRGFFSWLGFGKEEEKQPAAEEQTQQVAEPAQQQPEQEAPALSQAEAEAEETVALTETVASEQHEADVTAAAPSEAAPAALDDAESVVTDADAITESAAPEHDDAPVIDADAVLMPVEDAVSSDAPLSEEELTALALGDAEIIDMPHSEQGSAARAEDVADTETLPGDTDAPLSEEELTALALADAEVVAEEPVDESVPDTVSDLPLAAAPFIAQEQERPAKEGFFTRLKRSLVKTRQNLGSGFISLFRGKKIDDDLFDELEEQLLIADVGVDTTRRIITHLTQQANRKQLRDAEALYGLLKAEMASILAKVDAPLDVSGKAPFVILMVGVNGVGKTTTIGKLARQYQAEGKSVMLAAGDTFRAAAVEQLQVWGQRNNIPVIAQHTGADSASVIFDAIQAAKSRGVDVLIADTAGRLQNKSHLMEELKKITRVMKKLDESAPHEVMLTLDASTGQNAVSQARLFNEAVGLTGIALTKLDGTAKGGVIFSVADQFGIPIRYIGVGEGIEDLRPFKADDFIEALFARED
ncbi:signal recognition particle-docking protein FtsY [Pantoea anthophila]|uniref:signal recognition particle-docking protein FtsY n=1 Tax=Pantoea anthophila TaxID=470931 RepID=UPI002782824A|nr:signal recognition particle-docking protein FtsY [Pantoea anthophila]MDQ1213193.1 fused signal recognition particle receptor [Pantoea anthophila]